MTLHHHNGWPEFRWTVFERQLGQKDKTVQKQFHKKEQIKRTNIRVIKYWNSCLVLHLVVQDSVHQFIKISIPRIEKKKHHQELSKSLKLNCVLLDKLLLFWYNCRDQKQKQKTKKKSTNYFGQPVSPNFQFDEVSSAKVFWRYLWSLGPTSPISLSVIDFLHCTPCGAFLPSSSSCQNSPSLDWPSKLHIFMWTFSQNEHVFPQWMMCIVSVFSLWMCTMSMFFLNVFSGCCLPECVKWVCCSWICKVLFFLNG